MIKKLIKENSEGTAAKAGALPEWAVVILIVVGGFLGGFSLVWFF